MTRHGPIEIEGYVLGAYGTNCYLLRSSEDASIPPAIVDCGESPAALLDAAERCETPPSVIVLTHAHVDHIAGLFNARKRFPDAPIWIHENEGDWLTDARLNLSMFSGSEVTAPPAGRLLKDGEKVELAGVAWEVRHTPGHSPGSVSLYNAAAGIVLAGDALFNGSIGRTDFPGCSFEQLERSIRDRLYSLPDETTVYPGHGPSTTIGREKATNPFVRP
ncbi:MAG: hypothetical protein CMJ31_01890 [Phycisphaerae bacterium]|nr:hypothetical protein [Phycisphaerae bacterium]